MGCFSWRTLDTDRSISSVDSNRPTFAVYMVNPITGEYYKEENYQGYGIFGGKDFYELLAELNNAVTRGDGVDIECYRENYISPILVEDITLWEKYKGCKPECCIFQGYCYPETEEEEKQERIEAIENRIQSLKSYYSVLNEDLEDIKDRIKYFQEKYNTQDIQEFIVHLEQIFQDKEENIKDILNKINKAIKEKEKITLDK